MTVDYRLINVIQEDLSKTPKNIQIDRVNGQLVGTYTQTNNIISQISVKYKYSYDQSKGKRIKRYINGVNSISVDTQPGAIIKAKTTADTDEPSRFIVNETGQLNFDPGISTVSISHFRICGINVQKSKTVYKGSVRLSQLKDKYASLSFNNSQKSLVFSYNLKNKDFLEDRLFFNDKSTSYDLQEKNLIFSSVTEKNSSFNDKYISFNFSSKENDNLIVSYYLNQQIENHYGILQYRQTKI